MRVSVYNREKATQDGDIIYLKTTTIHCETCNALIDSKDTIVDGVRRAKTDRRVKPESADEKDTYVGPERRSGKERRIWVDRIQEIASRLSGSKDTR